MNKFETGKEIFWFKGEDLYSGRIHLVYHSYLVTWDRQIVDTGFAYFSPTDAISGMRKALAIIETDYLDNE